jgi:threonylcarbamoyladenosine tRNA methylthiotransferase MtaB
LNACESEAIADQGRRDGLSDALVFNTCAVTAEAVRQGRQAIRKARRERPGARIVVTGCAAQIDPAAFAAMSEVDLVVGNALKTQPGALAAGDDRVRMGDILAPAATAPPAPGLSGRARAYVEVQNGCDHRCTFCIIPFGRGRARSTPAEAVASRIRALVTAGCSEVVLTGVDLTSWGADLPGAPNLGRLAAHILDQVPELPRLRLSSIDAAEIDDELLALFAQEGRLMPYLHLSLQAGDDLILKRMKRRHLRGDAIALAQAVRAARPEIALGADLIAGFPTESEAAFENSLQLIDEMGLAFLHVFPFSPRPGTPAARMPPVPPQTVHERAARLRAAGEGALARHLDSRLNKPVSVLVERPGRGRAEDFTEVTFEGVATPGQVIAGWMTGHDGRRGRMSLRPQTGTL